MRISQIEFGSLLTYSPRGDSKKQDRSRAIMRALKNDEYITSGDEPLLMSEFIAETVKERLDKLPFSGYFKTNSILVPIPNSTFNRPHTLWVPQRLAHALARQRIGKNVAECLKRIKPLPKSATSLSENRPKAADHYDSIEVKKMLFDPEEILLIDDVVTRGATILGIANKLVDAFPKARIRAFAAMRTISSPDDFVKINNPCVGTIILRDGESYRNP